MDAGGGQDLRALVTDIELVRGAQGKPAHYHDSHQLIYISKGCASVTVSGRSYRAQPGTLVLISRFEQHSIDMDSECERYVAGIAPEYGFMASEESVLLLSALINRPESFRHAVELGDRREAERIFGRVLEERLGRKDGFGDYLSGLALMELLVMVYRSAPEIFASQRRENVGTVMRLQRHFERDFAANCSLAELAAQEHMSASHLSHIFKSVAGVSTMAYLKACRIAAAKRYLAQTELPVGEIVEKCGFSDSSNFSRTFREQTGMSPSEFRRRYREK